MNQDKNSDIQEELENRFLTYALSTIVSRSLPDVRDGLKPIHRRILYAMDSIGVSETAKHVKSAKIIGEVLGKYHPHGDASTYESMVRMAQDFSMRYPLVDGKGNFGSVDGDSPAAYRYTEARLTPITAYLLEDIKKDTVDFRQNYDNTLKEPVVLPSMVPNLLVNGSSGIAVGMACSFPSHNLKEVIAALIALTHDNNLSTTQLMKYIKGPDFPTGGILLTPKSELRTAYESGSGNIKIRGEWNLEDLPRGKQQIILTAIPYGVNKAKLIERIAEIIIAKKLPSLLDVRDESDENIRVVLEMKTGADAEKLMSYLIRHTDFETGFQINFTCLKPNGEPDRLSLGDICNYFLEFRKEVITRKLRYELALLEKRLHILLGFEAIFDDLDKALKLIRSSTSRQEAHDKLKKAFGIDDEQTKAILEIPLYRLVSMEIGKILEEKNEKQLEKKRITEILRSPAKILQEIRRELEEIDKKFGGKRLTMIKSIESLETVEYRAEDFIEHEDVSLVISRNGWIRKLKTLSEPSSLKFKENDELLGMVQANTRELAAFFTSFGSVYVQKIYNLPYTRSGFGEPIQSLFKFSDGEKVIHMIALPAREGDAEQARAESVPEKGKKQQKAFEFAAEGKPGGKVAELMVAGNSGFGFRFPTANLTETTRSGRRIMSVKNEDRMVGVSPVCGSHVFLASSAGKGLLVPLDQIPQLSGSGKGVKLIKLVNSQLAGFKVVVPKDKVTLVFDDGSEKPLSMSSVPEYNRGSQGVIISKRKKIINIV